ncbi:hypothetical protein GCM10020000_34630 [Streptomyces olivoverticillatus]
MPSPGGREAECGQGRQQGGDAVAEAEAGAQGVEQGGRAADAEAEVEGDEDDGRGGEPSGAGTGGGGRDAALKAVAVDFETMAVKVRRLTFNVHAVPAGTLGA